MGEDFGAWQRQPNRNWQSPNLNPSAAAKPDSGQSAFLKPSKNLASTNGFSPSFGLFKAPNLPIVQASEPRGWFYCLPRFRQAFTPGPPLDPKERFPSAEQKKFLVVDRSGDQTTLIFSSGAGEPVRCLASWKRSSPDLENTDGTGAERASKIMLSHPILSAGELNDNDETRADSEMREDTEELDALLYSDDEDGEEEDEVTSTGHSPSTMTSFDEREWCEEDSGEVASYAGGAKKRKLMDTASSAEPNSKHKPKSGPDPRLEVEDDAESSCGDGVSFGSREYGKKRIKKEKIRETVSVLQTIIPDGEGKDAIVVLDEAIRYLKIMKLKAEAFGLDSL